MVHGSDTGHLKAAKSYRYHTDTVTLSKKHILMKDGKELGLEPNTFKFLILLL